MNLQHGQRIKLQELNIQSEFSITIATDSHFEPDIACFALNATQKLYSDDYMVFYNQASSPCQGIRLNKTSHNSKQTAFDIYLAQLPQAIERLVFTLAIDAPHTLHELNKAKVSINTNHMPQAVFELTGQTFNQERAVMLLEIYRKDHTWRLSCTAQGFNGGLAKLVEHFGAEVAPVVAAKKSENIPSTISNGVVNLSKRVQLEKKLSVAAPQLVSLVKSAGVRLEKIGLDQHTAKVCLCLDISASMHYLYDKGLVQAFAERVLALACYFDDDGEIDIFLFGQHVHQPHAMNLKNFRSYISELLQGYPLEPGTNYSVAFEAIRKFYVPSRQGKPHQTPTKTALPTYVMFVTDGATSDEAIAELQLRSASYEGIFWQFMAIDQTRQTKYATTTDFTFLEKLDGLQGRLIDNANFFSVNSPTELSDDMLYQKLMAEYPNWLNAAKQQQLIP